MKPVKEYQIHELVQGYSKQYPQFTRLIQYDIPRSVRIAGYEERNPKIKPITSTINTFLEDSLRRTKTSISDLIICNEFDLFCTFTFNPKVVDRSNVSMVKEKMSQWLKRQRERNGKFEYLIVPEFHKDGKSIHFHALFKNYRGKLVEANLKTKSTRKIYNIKSYQLGYSTAVPIDSNIEKVGNYVKKYITKEMPLFSGKKRYWCSTSLIRPDVVKNPTIDPFTMVEFVQKYNAKGYAILERAGKLQTQIIKGDNTTWQQLTSTQLSKKLTSSQPKQNQAVALTNISN